MVILSQFITKVELQDEYHDVMITSSFLVTSGLKLTGSKFHEVFKMQNFSLIMLQEKVLRYQLWFSMKTTTNQLALKTDLI